MIKSFGSSDQFLYPLSPLDGRYAKKVGDISEIFSEFGLVKHRLIIEIEYLKALSKIIPEIKISEPQEKLLHDLVENFSTEDFDRISEIEKTTRHDVKAIEYFINEKINDTTLSRWVHWGLTSEDVNNLAQGLQLKKGQQILVSQMTEMLSLLLDMVESGKSAVMMARTHGQPAVPTTLGKELLVHARSIYDVLIELREFSFAGKLTGAVGSLAGHHFVFPQHDWLAFSNKFVKSLGLNPEIVTTQVLPPQNLLVWFRLMTQFSQLLHGFTQDAWWYISYGYFDQKVRFGQVGSSTMPQKVNPILFENAEGNLEITVGLARAISDKLVYSRLQRDLSDSTVRRNIGVVFGHLLLAISSIKNGLKDLRINTQRMSQDIDNHPEILAEGLQLLLKANGEEKGYEIIKDLTRGKGYHELDWHKISSQTKLSQNLINKISSLQPDQYLGWIEEVVKGQLAEMRKSIK